MPNNIQYMVHTSNRRSKPLSAERIREIYDAGRIPQDAMVRQVGTQLKIPIEAFLRDLAKSQSPKPCRHMPPSRSSPPILPTLMPPASAPENPLATRRCPFCAEDILVAAKKCKHCGEIIDPTLRNSQRSYRPQPVHSGERNKIVAFLLAFFLGLLGLHRFYLGQTGMGALYLVMNVLFCWTLVVPVVFGIICLIESIMYRAYSDEEFARVYG